MKFAEKLARLRKREGLSQEELAARLGVSRQAVSRWEMGTAMPDSPNLLGISRLFGVSADYLLREEYEREADVPGAWGGGPEARQDRTRLWAGGMLLGASLLGLLALGILSSVFPCHVVEAVVGGDREDIYTGLRAFLKTYRLEWLFALLWVTAVSGGLIAWFPQLQRLCSGLQKRLRAGKKA